MKIWKLWCDKVDKHNEKIEDSWAACDERWSPYYIFLPIVVFSFIFLTMSRFAIKYALIVAFIISLATTIFMYINWKIYE